MIDIEFSKFDFDDMAINPAILIIAKRNSGKSVITKEIMYKMNKNVDCFIVISKSEQVNPYYKHFIPDLYIYYKYDRNIL